MNKERLKRFADLAVKVGANVQQDQMVSIRATTETKEFARLLVEAAYNAGASKVQVEWNDQYVSRMSYEHRTIESLKDIPEWNVAKIQDFIDRGGCAISIASPIPGLNKGLNPKKMQAAQMASSKKLNFYREYMMGNKTQWTIVAAPNQVWAEKVFPDKSNEEAIEALWEAILTASRVGENNDPIKEWEQHNKELFSHNNILNDHNFKSLHFKNDLGTDITIGLVEDHVWAGGGETTPNDTYFNPNIPTEENFTMPSKYEVNGKVVATKPLNYQGNLIEDFYLVFKDGKVVEYGAEKEEQTLQNLLEFDEGSSYIGEIALISYDSPISKSDILFYNTLFDENASCHMALGRAYPMNIKNGNDLSKEKLKEKGYNDSMTHVDFMFGSEDLEITGTKQDGSTVQIFKDGNFVI